MTYVEATILKLTAPAVPTEGNNGHMERISGFLKTYEWGSHTALQDLLGQPADGRPWAEVWFGAHTLGPSALLSSGEGLDRMILAHPRHHLGDQVAQTYGGKLPFLLKVIALERPLSLQVHPTRDRAQEAFAAESAAGLGLNSRARNYRDDNHKPEMVLALKPFEALCGFRTPRNAIAILEGLDVPLTKGMQALLKDRPTAHGMRAAFRRLVSPSTRPSAEQVTTLASACAERLAKGASPSPHIDRTVGLLQSKYPGDSGVAAALLLNPVSLLPGEAMFVPAGIIHSYLSGSAVEIMASSDNVLRAGLTSKKVDADELLQCISVAAAPPVRIVPTKLTPVTTGYFAPVDDFALSVTTVSKFEGFYRSPHTIPGSGPRILLCLEGHCLIGNSGERHLLHQGEAVFVSACSSSVSVDGVGRIVQASIPCPTMNSTTRSRCSGSTSQVSTVSKWVSSSINPS